MYSFWKSYLQKDKKLWDYCVLMLIKICILMRKNWNKTENKATGAKKEANWEMKPIREKLNVMQKKRQEA